MSATTTPSTEPSTRVQRLASYTLEQSSPCEILHALALDNSVDLIELRIVATLSKLGGGRGAPVQVSGVDLAKMTDCSPRTVRRALRKLYRRGVVYSEAYPPGTFARHWLA